MNIKNAMGKFLFLSIIVAPFDGINIITFFLYNYAFCWATTIGILFYMLLTIKQKKIYFGSLSKIWCFFFSWSLLSTIINLNNILGVEFKGHFAEKSVIVSSISLIFLLFMIMYYTYVLVEKKNVIRWIYNAIEISFIIISIFSIIQLLAMMDIQLATDINMYVQRIINIKYDLTIANGINVDEQEFFSVKRVIGVSQEASVFGNYLTCLFPWLILGAIYFNKNIRSIIYCCLLILFTVFSYSRIAYGCIILELLCLLFILRKNSHIKKILIICSSFIGIGICWFTFYNADTVFEKILGVFLSFSDEADSGRLYSNLTRIGLQMAGINMFISSPIFGLGLGQFRFNYSEYLPIWSYLSPEIMLATDTGITGYFYSSFNTYIRVLSESGIVGLFIWFMFFIKGMKNYIYVLKRISNEKKVLIKIIMISYIMSITGFMNFDEYTFFYFWLLLVLSSALVKKLNKKENIF